MSRINIESHLNSRGEGFTVTVWRKVETVQVVRDDEGEGWVITETDSHVLANRLYTHKADALIALERHYQERG